MGGLGYFPTYTLGNLYAAQFMEQARRDLPGLEDDFRRGEFGRLKGWLNEKIHRHGMRWRPRDLCEKVTGQPLSHGPLVTYLRNKFGALYGMCSSWRSPPSGGRGREGPEWPLKPPLDGGRTIMAIDWMYHRKG